jgi:hypothetical protein
MAWGLFALALSFATGNEAMPYKPGKVRDKGNKGLFGDKGYPHAQAYRTTSSSMEVLKKGPALPHEGQNAGKANNLEVKI